LTLQILARPSGTLLQPVLKSPLLRQKRLGVGRRPLVCFRKVGEQQLIGRDLSGRIDAL